MITNFIDDLNFTHNWVRFMTSSALSELKKVRDDDDGGGSGDDNDE